MKKTLVLAGTFREATEAARRFELGEHGLDWWYVVSMRDVESFGVAPGGAEVRWIRCGRWNETSDVWLIMDELRRRFGDEDALTRVDHVRGPVPSFANPPPAGDVSDTAAARRAPTKLDDAKGRFR